jgi:acetoin utilization deacetylase AcuC-like enzyme
MGRVPVVYSPKYYADLHGHVFPIEKYRLVAERLLNSGWISKEDLIEPSPATRDDLLLVHTPAYLDDLFNLVLSRRTIRSEMALDRPIVDAFALATGGSIRAAQEAMAAGAAVNLGGGLHHAFPDHAEGFCYLHDVGVAVRRLKADASAATALVIDCDLHQGNGTAVIFANDPSVTTFSIHQESNYPLKEKSDLDVGLPDFAGDELYLGELESALARLFGRGSYDLAFYVAGADPYAGDVLGGLSLTLEGMRRRDRMVIENCHERNVAMAVVLAGGYASRVEDTAAIHAATVEELIRSYLPARSH